MSQIRLKRYVRGINLNPLIKNRPLSCLSSELQQKYNIFCGLIYWEIFLLSTFVSFTQVATQDTDSQSEFLRRFWKNWIINGGKLSGCPAFDKKKQSPFLVTAMCYVAWHPGKCLAVWCPDASLFWGWHVVSHHLACQIELLLGFKFAQHKAVKQSFKLNSIGRQSKQAFRADLIRGTQTVILIICGCPLQG